MSTTGLNGTKITDTTEISPSQSLDGTSPVVTVKTVADLANEYVAGGGAYWQGGALRVMPFAIDDLAGDFGDSIYERMLFDPHVKAAHVVRKKSIMALGVKAVARVRDKNAPDQKKAQEYADFCQRLLSNITSSFDDVMNDMLDALAFGNKIAELVWEYEESGQDKGKIVLADIKVKSRRTVAFVVDRYLNVVGILAVNPGSTASGFVGSIMTTLNSAGIIPGDTTNNLAPTNVLPREGKFAVLINEPHDSDPRGTSTLRAAYTSWWGKMQLVPEYLRYLAQWGSPSLIGYTAPGASTVTTIDANGKPTTTTAQQAMINSLIAFQNGSAMSFPFGAKVEALMAHMNPRSFVDDFDHFNSEITIAIMYQELATGGSGARVSLGQAKALQDILGTIIRQGKASVCRMIVRDIFTPAIIYNFGDDAIDLVPEATLGQTDQVDLAAMVASYGQVGYELSPSQFDAIDGALGLPPRDPEEITALMDRAKQLADTAVNPTQPTPQQQAINPAAAPAPGSAGTPGPNQQAGGAPHRTTQNNNSRAGGRNQGR